MFLLTYPLSTEKSLGETKISGNVWNYWYCCDVWAAYVSAAGLAKAKHPFVMIPLHPYRNPMTYVLINDKKNTNKKEILKLGSLNIAKLQTKQISFIYGNEKKNLWKQLLQFLNTKGSLHSSNVMNLTVFNGSQALLIRELAVIRISLLHQSASWLLSSNNLLNQIWTFSEPLSYQWEPSGESIHAIYYIQKKRCSFCIRYVKVSEPGVYNVL